jgi:hypothetical protein
MASILIPTVKSKLEIADLIQEISATASENHTLFVSSSRESVAKNINRGLEAIRDELIIKVDDDISGFQYGWDRSLLKPLRESKSIAAVGARLLNPDGTTQLTCSSNLNMHGAFVQVRMLPFCCVAIRNEGIKMDENFLGTGFDDLDYLNQLSLKHPNAVFIINNEVRLLHRNEQKGSDFLERNRAYFQAKWNQPEFRNVDLLK